MKREYSRSAKGFLLLVAFVVAVAPMLAQGAEKERVVNLPAGESVSGDYYNGGSMVDIAGPVSGDVMTTGGTVDISSQVGGDILVAGGFLNLSATVGGNVRMAGGSLDISGKIAKNLTAVGGNLKLASDSVVGGNTYLAGGTILAGGTNSGNLVIAGGNVELSGKTVGSIIVYSGTLTVSKGAEIDGTLTYYSENKADIAEGAVIRGGVTQKPPLEVAAKPVAAAKTPVGLAGALWKILACLVLALVAWRLWPARLQRFVAEMNSHFWEKLLWGLMLMIAIPIGAVIIMATVVGLPLGLIILGLYLVSLCLAGALSFLLFGKWLSGLLRVEDKPESFPWYAFLLGALVLSVIAYVPVLGSLTGFVVWLWALGTLYRSLW
ncbi:MAG: carbohydrate-binding domain-containing protein [Patescibacteria group bacterium]|nr:carbohydrate-binding domain-containing protein [Patescibacteria group bacterium]